MLSPCCLCVSPGIEMPDTWYVRHATWDNCNGILHKSLPSVCVFVSLLGNGSVKKRYRRNEYTRHNRRIVGRIVFYAVSVMSKESM
jgi:hypothetical protein